MKGEILFEKMTGISDQYVAEAALVPAVGVTPAPKKPFTSLSRVLHSGLGVACICMIAVIALLAGTAGVGRITTPAPEGTPPLARFGFTYELKNSDGTPWDGTVMPGDWVCVDTTIINRGLPFVYTGSSTGYHPDAYFVLQGNPSVSMQCTFMETCDIGTHSVAMGAEGRGYGDITIPENAVPGVYDLVLSYGEEQQVYKGVLTVGEIDTEGETQPPKDTTDSPFSFGYEPFDGFAIPGDFVRIEAWVINDDEPFTYIGNSYKETGRFYPTVTLYHQETGYTIKVLPPETAIEPILYTVETGQKGKNTYARMIPTDAPTGEYGLVLSYGGYECRFDNILTVAVP